MSGSPLLEVMNLEVVYGRSARAIQGVSFAVSEGAVTSMVGLNGAGKTTTIRAISGFLPTENVQVTDGEIMFDGKSLLGMKPYQTASLGIQVVPERNKVFDTLTVHENLELAWTGRRSDVVLSSYRHPDDVYEQFPFLAAKRQETALVLSGGERQMLAIMACLLSGPRLLVVDEASLGLAPMMTQRTMTLLRQINESHDLAVLVVDQDVGTVLSISDHGYVLENGRVVFEGASDTLLAHEDIKEFYLGQQDSGSYRNVKQYRRTRRWY